MPESQGPAGEERDGRRRHRGGAAVAGGTAVGGAAAVGGGGEGPNRRRRVAALAALAALVVAGIVLAVVFGTRSSHHTASPASSASSAASAPGSATSSAGSAISSASSAASASSSAAAGAAALPAYGLVGGGGVAARPATGTLAISGSAGDVLFAEDGTVLDASARQVVTDAAQAIRQHQATLVTVTGYTDAIGNAAVNSKLSLQRAQAVIAALRAQLGGTAVTYHAAALGKGTPVASNSTAAGRQLNRRVVITLG